MNTIKILIMIFFSVVVINTVSSINVCAQEINNAVVNVERVNTSTESVPSANSGFDQMWNNFSNSFGPHVFFSEGQSSFQGMGRIILLALATFFLFLAIFQGLGPMLLIPISFGIILSNIPVQGMGADGALIGGLYRIGIETGIFPLLMCLGLGAMIDFGPMIANPWSILIGAVSQLGVFVAMLGIIALSQLGLGLDFDLQSVLAVSMIGAADGPTSVFLGAKLAPQMLGAIAISVYFFMAILPVIQPPLMRLLTSDEEKKIKMESLRFVGRTEKMLLPLIILGIAMFFLPKSALLIGAFMFGNFIRECGVVSRLADITQNTILNLVTVLMGLGLGAVMTPEQIFNLNTLVIFVLGLAGVLAGTVVGILITKILNTIYPKRFNPIIGAAGVAALPMAARVAQNVGLSYESDNYLLMHAMGANVAGFISSLIIAGVFISFL